MWQTTLDDLPNSNIITYGVDGRQYVAIVVGLISDNAEDWEMTYRRFAPDEGLPINDAPKGGAAIWVFALPVLNDSAGWSSSPCLMDQRRRARENVRGGRAHGHHGVETVADDAAS